MKPVQVATTTIFNLLKDSKLDNITFPYWDAFNVAWTSGELSGTSYVFSYQDRVNLMVFARCMDDLLVNRPSKKQPLRASTKGINPEVSIVMEGTTLYELFPGIYGTVVFITEDRYFLVITDGERRVIIRLVFPKVSKYTTIKQRDLVRVANGVYRLIDRGLAKSLTEAYEKLFPQQQQR